MTEQELRVLVREAIARHLACAPASGAAATPLITARQHASHGVFTLPESGAENGPCLIEPSVQCNHCGYCKSYGH